MKLRKLLSAVLLLSLPAMAQAADITGVPKIREGDQLQIGNHRIRLGWHRRAGRRSALPQHQGRALDLRRRRARRTDQALRRQELDLSYQGRHRPPRPHGGALRGRRRGHPEMAGVERLGAGGYAGLARLRGRREGRARGQGRDVARRVHRAMGLARPQQEDRDSRRGQAAGECQGDPAGVGIRFGRALARLHHQGQRQPLRRMHLSSADEPLVCEDRDEDLKRHALVLLGRGGRSSPAAARRGGSTTAQTCYP